MSIQQMLLGVGSSKKTYLDDIFATTLYVGNEGSKTVTTGIDLATDGGLVIGKSRAGSHAPFFYDTVRGVQKYLRGDVGAGEVTLSTGLTAFSTTGFSVGSHVGMNDDVKNAAWSFKKTPGFFDVVTYSGNGSNQNISHSLGCVPGCIMVKRLNSSKDWCVYHRSIGNSEHLEINNTDAEYGSATRWNATDPTASVFSVGENAQVNSSSGTYVAYLFAGGESTAATARSVSFDGSGDSLNIPDNDAWYIETNYTAECWFKMDEVSGNGWDAIFGQWQNSGAQATNSWILEYVGTDLRFYYLTNGATSSAHKSLGNVSLGQWHHFAFSKSGSSTRLFVDGTQVVGTFDIGTMQNGTGEFTIGGDVATDGHFKGQISNVRITKGQALYTSSFKVTNEPLTTTSQGATASNVKLLCCNNSSPTGSTVTPDTITNNNGSTASTDSPFDDPAGFVFGGGKQNVIKCGSYVGSGSAGLEINVGWEPQWVMIKNTSGTGPWMVLDSMRGVATGGLDEFVKFNEYETANDTYNVIDFTSTGFKVNVTGSDWNGSGAKYSFTAIRRPDGYVGKLAEAGTDAFAMDTGAGNSTIPNFDSTFPVDMAIWKKPADGSHAWGITTRFTWNNYLPISNAAQISGSGLDLDSNVGWQDASWADSNYQSWMFKRHAGFDVVTYEGNSTGNSSGDSQNIPHSLNAIPEMMWVKCRNDSRDWFVYHKGFNGGTTPEQWNLKLNTSTDEAQDSNRWNNTAPTSTHFTVGAYEGTNASGDDYIAILFASVNGISKLGSYTGNGSTGQTITVGFQPRYLIIKCVSEAADWQTFDTVRGLGNSFDPALEFNTTDAQDTVSELNKTSTAFILGNHDKTNKNNAKFIYYAHA